MKRLISIAVLASLAGCSTLNNAGIGGAPTLACSKSGQAVIDDRIVGSQGVHLSIVRRFADGDPLCVVAGK